jgi:hypothetical protein
MMARSMSVVAPLVDAGATAVVPLVDAGATAVGEAVVVVPRQALA